MPLQAAFQLAFAEGATPSPLMQFFPLILIAAIFYFFLIAPMRKRQKAVQAMIQGLQKGDHVYTNGGLYGEVSAVLENVVVLRIADNVKVRVAKSAVAGMEGKEEEGGGS